MNRSVFLLLGPVLAGLSLSMLLLSGNSPSLSWTVAVTVWCVVWWVFEPVPIPVTSLLPIALFPLVGVISATEVAKAYGSPLILLLLGGCILSTAMAHSGAHRRIALTMVRWFGGKSQRHLVFGFMTAAAFMSMWISNTATTLMLLPVALAILEQGDRDELARPLLLGIAFAASLGGIGTPIGTPPNLVFMQVYQENTGIEVGFTEWMSWAVPVILIFLPLMALWLTRSLKSGEGGDIPDPGPWRVHEKRVLWVFALTALAWMTRKEPFGGWSGLLELPGANDASVALLAVLSLFVIPRGDNSGERLLNWKVASDIPWGILLLFSGGICIAKAFTASGLSQMIGDQLVGLTVLPVLLMIFVLCLAVTFLTETTSNTASTTLLMPILAAAALGAQIDPLLLMVPAAMTASCAFMLPVATAPNAVVFGTGRFTVKEMAREGVVLNLIGVTCVTGMCYLLLA